MLCRSMYLRLLAFILLFHAGLSHAGVCGAACANHVQCLLGTNDSGVKDKRSDSTFSEEGQA